uniref:Uncharacterized protein n=1 Tax=Physcomitrium patens TaxID=3218 RepID=A0A2K1IAA4_PHYPA|nr:hypothetical protein PHYPA_030781 [Physcomitrium patens]
MQTPALRIEVIGIEPKKETAPEELQPSFYSSMIRRAMRLVSKDLRSNHKNENRKTKTTKTTKIRKKIV